MYVFFEQPATYDQDIMIQIACYSSYTARVATTRVHMHVTKAEHTNSCFPPPPTCIYKTPLPRTVAQWQRDDTSSCFLLICVMLLISERVRTFMYSSSIVTYIILYFPLCVFFCFCSRSDITALKRAVYNIYRMIVQRSAAGCQTRWGTLFEKVDTPQMLTKKKYSFFM